MLLRGHVISVLKSDKSEGGSSVGRRGYCDLTEGTSEVGAGMALLDHRKDVGSTARPAAC